MAGFVIRRAEKRDQSRLAELKGNYIRKMYRGFLDKAVLDRIDMEFCTPEISVWLEDKQYTTDVLELDGEIEGFVVYGPDPEDEGWGLIVDIRTSQPVDAERKRILIEHALDTLKEKGFPTVHIWLVHDNFRVRFLFESLGFRNDGELKEAVRSGQRLLVDRYRYQE